ncbi:MAG: hypothetical protein ACR2LR_19400, partial [Hassallia sp.]
MSTMRTDSRDSNLNPRSLDSCSRSRISRNSCNKRNRRSSLGSAAKNRIFTGMLCGVRPETFGQMLEVVRSLKQHKRKPGRPVKLGLEDQLLMT